MTRTPEQCAADSNLTTALARQAHLNWAAWVLRQEGFVQLAASVTDVGDALVREAQYVVDGLA
jgi:hypothetical protein